MIILERDIDSDIQRISQKIFEKSKRWIEENLNFFDITVRRKTATDDLQFKAFIELLFMSDMFYPNKLFDVDIEKKICKLEKKVLNQVSFSGYFFHDPTLISGNQETMIFNNNHNLVDRAINDDNKHFKNLVNAKFDLLAQRTPYRLLDSSYSMYKAKINTNLRSRKFYYELTVLANEEFNYLFLSDSSAYSITHSLFYVTDMGREHPSYINYKFIENTLLKMIVFYACKNNMDIMGESLLSLFFTRTQEIKKNKNIILSALKLIESNQNQKGYVYSPRHLDDKDMTEEEQFFENYHTTMVNLGVANVFR